MDLRSAPARPPPPPPPPPSQQQQQQEQQNQAQIPEGRQDIVVPNYIDSPDGVTSPPSFAEAIMAPSPISPSPPHYTPYSPGEQPPAFTSLARGASQTERYTDGPQFADEPAYAADSGDEDGPSSAPGERYNLEEPNIAIAESETGEGHAGGAAGTAGASGHQNGEDDEDEDGDEDDEIPELPPVIIITGAASGLGLAFFQHFSEREPTRPDISRFDVIGIDKSPWRLPGKGFQWKTTIGRTGKFVQLDLTASERRLHNFTRNHLYAEAACPSRPGVRRRFPRPVSLVIHCAATRGVVPTAMDALGGDPIAASSLDVMDADTMRRAFDVNVVGGLQLVQALLPHLQLHAEHVRERQDEVADAFGGSTEWLDQLRQQGSRASLQITRPLPPRDPPPRVVVMGSRMGSVGANAAGGAYAFRASKAALNAVVRSLSIDVPEVCFASVYPGSLKTGMVSVKEEPVITCQDSLEEMLPLIDKLGFGKLASGCFVDRFGDPMKF